MTLPRVGRSHPYLTSYTFLSQNQALARLALATVYVAWSMSGVVAFAFMLSTMTNGALAAVAGGVGFAIISEILNVIRALGGIRGWLPTHWWGSWQGLFAQPMTTSHMANGALLQVLYVTVFLTLAFEWFRRRDVLS